MPYLAPSPTQLTVDPGASVTVRDAAPYDVLCVQGHGRFGRFPIESPTLIRVGALTDDEYFVSEARAKEGVRIVNESTTEPLVLLKQFGPGNPDLTIDPNIRVDALGRSSSACAEEIAATGLPNANPSRLPPGGSGFARNVRSQSFSSLYAPKATLSSNSEDGTARRSFAPFRRESY